MKTDLTGRPAPTRLSVEIAIIERHLAWLRAQMPDETGKPIRTMTADEVERAHVASVLTKVGTMAETARVTGISRRQLHRKIKKWGLVNPHGRKQEVATV